MVWWNIKELWHMIITALLGSEALSSNSLCIDTDTKEWKVCTTGNFTLHLFPIIFSLAQCRAFLISRVIAQNEGQWKASHKHIDIHITHGKKISQQQQKSGLLLTTAKEIGKKNQLSTRKNWLGVSSTELYHNNCPRLCFNTSQQRQLIPLSLMSSFLSYYSVCWK